MISIDYNDYCIKINDNVLVIMSKYIQCKSKYESGGILIGSILIDGKTIEINDCTEPIRGDKASRYGFYRCTKHNEILEKKWIESNYINMYLGEWHTHPQSIPSPSYVDKKSWTRLIKDSITDSPIIIFLIIGIETIEIWIGNKSHNKLERVGSYGFRNSTTNY
ncbi:Mov34/MPN/PAD-1 family protein [Clostridium tertium]|nr:Mov34/MPN/PAD-1 family protein [Clostridium tertium]